MSGHLARTIESALAHKARIATGAAIAATLMFSLAWRHSTSDWQVTTAARSAFAETIVEAGTVAASRVVLYGSTTVGQAVKLLDIVPEGRFVHQGDVLMRFDSSAIEQSLLRERATLEQAKAELLRAREELRLESIRGSSEMDTAERQIEYARSQLDNQESGRGKLELAEAEAAGAEAAREVERTRSAYEDLKPLLAEGFVTRRELDLAHQAWKRAEELQQLAEVKRKTLSTYERPAALNRTRSELTAAEQSRERQRETIAARTGQRQAAISVIEARVREVQDRIALLESQLGRAIVSAERDGLVVYRDLFFGSERRKPQVGDEVWANQPVIAIPDASSLTVETHVREIDLHKVVSSQRVEVTVEAYPDLRLRATVGAIGALGQDDPARAGAKRFPLTVNLLDSDPRLRSGMTARIAITVAEFADAVTVPVEAVQQRPGGSICFIVSGGTITPRPVTVRAENEMRVAIDGITPGERVIVPRSAAEAAALIAR